MDIAYYISDLLGQQGELTVPNLGYFVQIRMPAYYDNQAKKFFPPHYSVQFDPQTIEEDDSLANYITGVKNISLASAKYFIEKYIANLKSQAVVEEVPFAQLGAFNSDGLKLSFVSTTKMDDPAFFAFRPLEAYRVGDAKRVASRPDPAFETPKPTPVLAPTPMAKQPKPAPIVVQSEPIAPLVNEPVVEEEEYYEEAPRRMSVWIYVLIAITVLVIAGGALYKFKPDVFRKYIPIGKQADTTAAPKVVIKHEDVVTDSTGNDSLKSQEPIITPDTVPVDTVTVKPTAKKPEVKKQPDVVVETKKPEVKPKETKKAPVVAQPTVALQPTNTMPANIAVGDDVTKGMYVIYSGAFPIRSLANKRIEVLKGKGFTEARLAKQKVGPGGNYKVILGAFKTRQEAADHRKELLLTNKLKSTELIVDQF
jgi:hypothetical protein